MAILGVIIGLYVLYCAFLYVFQGRFLFFPDSMLALTPESPYESVNFSASDGTRLHGWFIPAKNARAVLCFFHGNAGNISHRIETIQTFNRLNLDVFIFDYRGYGKSEGSPSEIGLAFDAEGAWKYLTETLKIDPKRIVLLGRSLGGAVAARLAEKVRPAALVIESTFTSIPDVAKLYYSFVSAQLLTRYKFPTKTYVQNVSCPVLVVHSKDDEIIPFSHGQELYRLAKPPKEFLELSGTHNEGQLFSGDIYEKAIDEFIAKHVA